MTRLQNPGELDRAAHPWAVVRCVRVECGRVVVWRHHALNLEFTEDSILQLDTHIISLLQLVAVCVPILSS